MPRSAYTQHLLSARFLQGATGMTEIEVYGGFYRLNPTRLWNKAERSGACLLWTGAGAPHYGHMNIDGRFIKTHVIAYALSYGAVPLGKVVRHSCDTPSCIEPAHLSLGTYLDNTRDMWSRGRANPRRRFTLKDFSDIQALYASGLSQYAIAEIYNVRQPAVSRLLSGARYAEWSR